MGEGQATINMDDGESNPLWGMKKVNGHNVNEPGNPTRKVGRRLRIGNVDNVMIRVRKNRVVLVHNDETIFDWNGTPNQLSLWKSDDLPDEPCLFFRSRSAFDVHKMTMTPIGDSSAAPAIAHSHSIARGVWATDWEWSKPVELSDFETQTELELASVDGLSTLLFDTGKLGTRDIWQRNRLSGTSTWSKPQKLNSLINTGNDNGSPFLSRDRKSLIFASERSGGIGQSDLWISTRDTADGPWSDPVYLGDNVNSAQAEGLATLSANGLQLIFASDREGGIGSSDLWECTRESTEAPWSPARNITSLNTPDREHAPLLSSDGLSLVLTSDRPGGLGSADLWLSQRSSLKGRWSQPINLGEDVNTPDFEYGLILSADSRSLIYHSHPGKRSTRLSRRVRKVRTDASQPPRLAIAPFDEPQAKAYQQAWADYLGLPVEKNVALPGGSNLALVLIPPGEFLMGSGQKEQLRALEIARAANDEWAAIRTPIEGPQHRVRIIHPFYMGKYETTKAQWQAVMRNLAAGSNDDVRKPVEGISWDDVQTFLEELNTIDPSSEFSFTLPTEAQWEYACRAGTPTAWYSGERENELSHVGWFTKNSHGESHPVGELRANAYGLYDTHGNVWEWCEDWLSNNYGQGFVDDPAGPTIGQFRMRRGGSWKTSPETCRSARRDGIQPAQRGYPVGFRIAATIDTAKLTLGITDDTSSSTGAQQPVALTRTVDALEFDARSSYVEVPTLRCDDQTEMTMEAWINPDEQRAASAVCFVITGGHSLSLQVGGNPRWEFGGGIRESGLYRWASGPQIQQWGQRTHVAGTYGDGHFTLFVDGEKMKSVKVPDGHKPAGPLCIGRSKPDAPSTAAFKGTIDEIRISRTVRYKEDFTPEQRFGADATTLALYHFDEGQGDVLKDSSGNNHHGKIVDAKWVQIDGGPLQQLDLLADVNLEKLSAHNMNWKLDDGLLVGSGIAPTNEKRWSGCAFHQRISGDYDLDLEFKQSGFAPLQFDLPLGREQAIRIHLADHHSALTIIDGKQDKDADEPHYTEDVTMRNNVWHQLTARVRHDGDNVSVDVGLDGITVGQFSGARSRISLPDTAGRPNSFRLKLVGHADFSTVQLAFRRAVVSMDKPRFAAQSTGPDANVPSLVSRVNQKNVDSFEVLTSPDWEWTEPVNLGPEINSPTKEGAPCVSRDGLTLVFAARRHSKLPDIWMATRSSTEHHWSPPRPLKTINDTQEDNCPTLSPDGRALVFFSARPGGQGGPDLWMSTR